MAPVPGSSVLLQVPSAPHLPARLTPAVAGDGRLSPNQASAVASGSHSCEDSRKENLGKRTKRKSSASVLLLQLPICRQEARCLLIARSLKRWVAFISHCLVELLVGMMVPRGGSKREEAPHSSLPSPNRHSHGKGLSPFEGWVWAQSGEGSAHRRGEFGSSDGCTGQGPVKCPVVTTSMEATPKGNSWPSSPSRWSQ